MSEWKMPPKAKVYEALSALVDGRVKIIGSNQAEVTSSAGDKIYSVEWLEGEEKITSNDNASYWQGYIGYPIIAVLLTTKRITCNQEAIKSLVGVPWKKINTQFKGNYDKAVEDVIQSLEAKGVNRQPIVQEVDSIYEQLRNLRLQRGSQRKLPPK